MNKYEEEMFDFLVTEENLQALIIAKNQFPLVRERLIQNFWNKVFGNVKNGLIEYENWEVKLEENITKWYSKLYIKEKNVFIFENHLPSFIFCWQRLNQNYPFYGFWINEQTNEFDVTKVKEYIGSIQKENFAEYHGYDDWFLLWEGVESFNFSNDETLLQIIPSLLEEKAKDFSDRILDLFEKCQIHYNHIQTNFKIQ
jgi:hypothetical protein